jgi:hypothetical protein
MSTNSVRVTCYFCGKLSHRGFECRSKALNEKQRGEKAVDDHANKFPHITCLKCNKKGHYTNKCPERSHTRKKENKTNDIAEMGIFVGTTIVSDENKYSSPVSNGFIPDSFLTTLTWMLTHCLCSMLRKSLKLLETHL